MTPLGGGTNNDSYAVEHGGERYLLRIYRHAADPERIRYEHELLSRLNGAGLPFAVPAPLPARSDDTLVTASNGAAAALFPFFMGMHASSEDQEQLRACGAALAELDLAMAAIELPAPAAGLPAFGAFPAAHAASPGPDAVVAALPLEESERRHLLEIMQYLGEVTPRMARHLPGQVVHRDFDGSNVLMDGRRVAAVLDFEFARPDIRALDLATGLGAFGGAGWDPADESWRLAFAEGYLARLRLRPAELEAVPDLMLLVRAGSLLHRAGRERLGMASREEVLARAQALLRRAAWLEVHGEALVERLLST
jgi:Ser/Thr protein kinase RdoA (MazF antagonist)